MKYLLLGGWISAFLLMTSFSQAQSVVGFWQMARVDVGDMNMTPVAKWTRIHEDGSYESGNGWLQNGNGTWMYDDENQVFTNKNFLDIADRYGGFKVSFEGENMIWQREEDGMEVIVTLEPIEELPMSPADYLEGLWSLEEHGPKEDASKGPARLMMGWDRIFRAYDEAGKKSTGYWHIHGHKPEVTLLPHLEGGVVETWRIEVNEEVLKMQGISDSNKGVERRYTRIFSH